jgi:uncharacterized membrane protein YjdF
MRKTVNPLFFLSLLCVRRTFRARYTSAACNGGLEVLLWLLPLLLVLSCSEQKRFFMALLLFFLICVWLVFFFFFLLGEGCVFLPLRIANLL